MEINSDEMAVKRGLFELERNSYRKYDAAKPETLKKGDIITVSGNWDQVDDGKYEVIDVYEDEMPPRCTLKCIKLVE